MRCTRISSGRERLSVTAISNWRRPPMSSPARTTPSGWTRSLIAVTADVDREDASR